MLCFSKSSALTIPHWEDLSGAYIVTITGHSFTVCIYTDSGRLVGAQKKYSDSVEHICFLNKTKTSRRCISVSFKPLSIYASKFTRDTLPSNTRLPECKCISVRFLLYLGLVAVSIITTRPLWTPLPGSSETPGKSYKSRHDWYLS